VGVLTFHISAKGLNLPNIPEEFGI
jgi:hypothetical protein